MKLSSRILPVLAAVASLPVPAAAAPPVGFDDYTRAFDRFEARSRGRPMSERVSAFRMLFGRLRPGLYADRDPAQLDRRIAAALTGFPALRPAYRIAQRRFPGALVAAVARFRTVFPHFVPPLPIIFAHELGMRDGGTDYVSGRKVMLFGADVIALYHNDDSLEPFLQHELFHLEHARHFADCDQLWCPLWQEGLATYAALQMTPGASDRQLLLDLPQPIRGPTDAHWEAALCLIASRFDSTDTTAIDEAFLGNRHPPDLPPRFGYYVGLKLAQAAGAGRSLPTLAELDNSAARPAARTALMALLKVAQAPCAAPPPTAPITHAAPRPA